MKKLVCLLALFTLVSAGWGCADKNTPATQDKQELSEDFIRALYGLGHTPAQIEGFLNTVFMGEHPLWNDDSVAVRERLWDQRAFAGDEQLDVEFSARDMSQLKGALWHKEIDRKLAERLFTPQAVKELIWDDNDRVYIEEWKFDDRHSAVALGLPNTEWYHDIWFFAGNRLVARHKNLLTKYLEIDLHHYRDKKGRLIVWYEKDYHGWCEYRFYHFKPSGKLVPVLCEFAGGAGNTSGWGWRSFEVGSDVIAYRDTLTIRMRFEDTLPYGWMNEQVTFRDSVDVKYVWKNGRMERANFGFVGPRILSYGRDGTGGNLDLPFIQSAHYELQRAFGLYGHPTDVNTLFTTLMFLDRVMTESEERMKQQTTVLGKYPDYIELANKLGANKLDVPMGRWNAMSADERWAETVRFLDGAVERGDNIVLSTRVTNINEATGTFRRELEYLIRKGYALSADGLKMVRPKDKERAFPSAS